MKRVGHRFAEVIKVLADHYDTDSGSFLDCCVKSAILGSWQDMEVITIVMVIIPMIINISIKLQFEVAILDICILLLVSRALTFPCNVIDSSPFFRVVRIEIVTEVQSEFSI